MSLTSSRPAESAAPAVPSVFRRLLPTTALVFVAFLISGLPLPVLSLHVHDTLGFGDVFAGLAVSCQFAAALLTRAYAGGVADLQGASAAVRRGLLVAIAAGVAQAASTLLPPALSLAVLLLGRALLGAAESLVITGALGWGVGQVGPQHAGKVMAWTGIAIYGALGGAAPLGVALHGQAGFGGVALASTGIAVLALGLFTRMPAAPAPAGGRRTPFYQVLRLVLVPGAGLALAGVGFGAIVSFLPLLYASRGWGSAGTTLTGFAAAYIVARLFFAGLPDRLGGARVALVCLLIEMAGQAMIWRGPSPGLALLGAALTGFGFSLVFPAFGVEAVRRVPAASRGAAMGAYVAFLDIALGVAGPALGLLAGPFGYPAVYLSAGLAAMVALLLAWHLRAGE